MKIVLLCEDMQTIMFIRRFLKKRKFKPRDIFVRERAAGKKSGEQWVREEFPKELRYARSGTGRFLIVVIDADTGSKQDRLSQLTRECTRQGIAGKTDSDPVILAVPRRNIETWFAYLQGTNVEETTAYPRLRQPRDCLPLADELYRMCHRAQSLREPVPPSLQAACREYPKLKRER